MKHEELLIEIKAELNKTFGGSIRKVILFGSRIENTYRDYSDYDILILLEKSVDWRTRDRILDVLTDVNIKHDILIDAHIIAEPELNTIRGKQPFIENAMKTGIAV